MAAVVAAVLVAATVATTAPANAAEPFVPDHAGFPNPTEHSQQAYEPESDFTSKWTRADAMQMKAMSDPTAPAGENSMPEDVTMPTVPQDFPDMSNDEVWVWDSWTLTDGSSDQPSYKGWEVLFSLVADRDLGFDERHLYARLGYFFRKADIPDDQRPENGGWTYGGLVFPENDVTSSSTAIFEDRSFSHYTQWSGSTRLMEDDKLRLFYTSVAFFRDPVTNADTKPYDPRLVQTEGRIFADETGVWFTGFRDQHELLKADGEYYQNGEQNPFFNFRDPFTFEDPANPGETYMVFEGNTAVPRENRACTADDLGYAEGDPEAESLDEVLESGATYQMANVGLAVSENLAMTDWKFLPPILSANCVTDQTERPQIYIEDGKYYLFTISHRGTYAWNIDGPEGVYGFVGDGIRSDFQPMNQGSGLVLGNPTNLNIPRGDPFAPAVGQHPGHFQSYSHYVMPDGLVQSFIDTIGTSDDFTRGGTLAPTVRLDIDGSNSRVDRSYGVDGLGGWADVPSNLAANVPSTPDPRPTP
ncbi:levansucrase [Agromyces aureus]|uniref:Levansucrase n=1 Tax=Agromyces aureus TaxID=453304 RepID=A0A191WKG8_9MICO|nr:levansucrase [Agromyces aureus]